MRSKALIFRLILILGMFVVATIYYAQLPDQIPIHWGITGMADGWGSKIWAAWMIPGMSLVLLLLFPFLAKIDPKKENYKNFSEVYEKIQTLIIVFFTLIFSFQYYFTFHPQQQSLMTPLLLSALGVMFIVMGNYMGKVRQNFFVGLKTPWTLADPEVWQKSQRLTGWMFVLGGIVLLIEAWLQTYIFAALILIIIGVAVVPTVYSYIIYKKKIKDTAE